MTSPGPGLVRVKLYFWDTFHEFAPHSAESVLLDSTDYTYDSFEDIQVAKLLLSAQIGHRSACKNGKCDRCPGAMFVKAAWLLNEAPKASPAKLDHNPANGIRFMVPQTTLSVYHEIHQTELIVLLETTFDRTDKHFRPPRDTSDGKRKWAASQEETHSSGKQAKQPKVVPVSSPRICIVPGAVDPTAPLTLLPPSVPFESYPKYPGSILVDKSCFIPAFETLFGDHFACIVSLPPGMGKTALLMLLISWYERRDVSLPSSLFKPLGVTTVEKNQYDAKREKPPAWAHSVATCLCLVFDLADVDAALNTATVEAINQYLCRTMRAFVAKHQGEFGENFVLSAAKLQERDSVGIIKQIITRAAVKQLQLFIGVDHWDAPILTSLEWEDDSTTEAIAVALDTFLLAFDGMPEAFNDKLRPKLLVLGNLPLLDMSSFIKDVSCHELLQGAFGASTEEADELFLALSHNRRMTRLKVDPLRFRMGQFIPPSTNRGYVYLPPPLYSFTLLLHQAAKSYEIENKHRDPPDSPRLRNISQRCEHLLRYSNLRQELSMPIPPVRGLSRTSLRAHAKNEADLRILLFYLGALVTTSQELTIAEADQTWTVKIASDFALQQLFDTYPRLENLTMSKKDIQIRALLERNPRPILDVFSRKLRMKPLLDVYGMNEGVFQQMWDDFFEYGDIDSAYADNYFPQLLLVTNTAAKEGEVATAPGMGRHSYMDLGVFAMLQLHPGRAVTAELKVISLRNLYRAMCDSDKACEDLVRGTGPSSTFRQQCWAKIDEIKVMPLEELRRTYYSFKSYDRRTDTWTSTRRLIGTMLDDAERQLDRYMNAVVNGKAHTTDQGHSDPEGIFHEERIVVKRAPEGEADEVFGIVVVAIGRRIIGLVREAKKQNTRYQYRAKPGWFDMPQ